MPTPPLPLHFHEWQRPWGYLTLEVYQRGKLIGIQAGPNIVVNGGKNLWNRRLFNGTTATGVAKMAVGDGGTPPTSLFSPTAFVVTNTALNNSISLSADIDPSPVEDLGAKTITFVTVLASALANAANFHFEPRVINEIALQTAAPDNVIVALRSFRSIPFDPLNAMEVRASWTLGLT
jgi:hypothetical protein